MLCVASTSSFSDLNSESCSRGIRMSSVDIVGKIIVCSSYSSVGTTDRHLSVPGDTLGTPSVLEDGVVISKLRFAALFVVTGPFLLLYCNWVVGIGVGLEVAAIF